MVSNKLFALFFTWIVLLYLAMWLGGGWHELFVSALTWRTKLVAIMAGGGTFLVCGLYAQRFASETKHAIYGRVWDSFVIIMIWVFCAGLYGAVTDPLIAFGLWPWQWLTVWVVIPLLCSLVRFAHIGDELSPSLEFETRRT